MTNYFILAAGDDDPQQWTDNPNPLLPAGYDLVWSLICFIIIFLLFWKFVLPAFKKVLADREEQIEGGIQRAEAAQDEAKAALEKYNSQLAEARTEAAQIRDDARAQGQKIVAEAQSEAKAKADLETEKGQKTLQQERERVVGELRQEMGTTSVNLAEKLLGHDLADEAKRSGTIDSFLADLDSVGSGK
jgi:F-type H+-transporting ATPase subunit b